MRRIFILMILAAAHLVCSAQTNPKIEALYDYLKDQGIVHSYDLYTTYGRKNAIYKRFVVHLDLFDESRFADPFAAQYDIDSLLCRLPGAGVDAEGNPTVNGKKVKKLLVDGKEVSLDGKVVARTAESKIDSAYRAKAVRNREAYKQIRRTLSELQDEAAESYSYEYHQHGADTIITTMALKNPANTNANVRFYKQPLSQVPLVKSAPENIYFRYFNLRKELMESNPYAPIGLLLFTYEGIVSDAPEPTKNFDIAAFQKNLAFVLKDKSIKRHELICRHDSTFDRYAYNDSLYRIGQLTKGFKIMESRGMGTGGENRYTIYKLTNEEQAKVVLRQVLDCANQQIKDNPEQIFKTVSDAYFEPNYFINIFSAHPCSQSYQDYYDGKRDVVNEIDIKSIMDTEGFYIIINVHHGDETFPCEWKTLKSMVNGEKVYYKDAL